MSWFWRWLSSRSSRVRWSAPTLGAQSLYLFLMPAVLTAGMIGGLGPGLLATFLCLVLHLVLDRRIQQSHQCRFAAFRGRVVPSRHVRDVWDLVSPGLASGFSDARTLADESTRAALAREAHVQSILETIPDAMVVIDIRGVMQFIQRGGRAAVRLQSRRGDRQERKHAHAVAVSRAARRLSRTLPAYGRAQDHRDRSRRRRRTQGRLHLSDGVVGRRNEIRQGSLLYRIHSRSERAPEDRIPAAGTAIRTGPHLAPDRDGRDGFDIGPRAQSAAVGDLELSQRLASFARSSDR